jgi:hypothetical protein
MTVQPFPMVEMAVKELIEALYPAAVGKVGGDLAYESGDDLYVFIGLIGGSTTQVDGQWVVDIDTFAPSYAAAMQASLDLEALLIGPRHVTSVMRLDNTYQNEGPVERPWDDDTVFRVGATYAFTARRTG